MSWTDFAFNPATGLQNTIEYEQTPASEARVREILQTPSNQLREFLNSTVKTEMMRRDVEQTMTAQLTAKTGTDYDTKQVRNIRFKATDDFTTDDLAEGEIGFVYDP